ncbi:MaoC family dehydratase [Capillimicrobium parvum]|uniref:MaoC family dehydratase n=1 Tax=Capillimicrobium parvum TaxID=2884022 RepID=UPI00216B0E1C|nr:MaoC family dehydratase [Capillimicrobium parvum]
MAGPYFDDLEVGDRVVDAPAITLTDGHAALHQAILGDRLRLSLDAGLSRRVLGAERPLAHPSLVCDMAIGQSTWLTQRVIGNLFYRGLVLRRPVLLGDTLRTTTTVEALRENRRREGRAPTGLAVLRVTTVDQDDRPVLDFWRCAMLPLSEGCEPTGRADDVDAVGTGLSGEALEAVTAGWDLDAFRAAMPDGAHFAQLSAPARWAVEGGDVVSCAPELARMTLNVAVAHHDAVAGGGRRLVYGGHTIGIAASHLCRALPNLVTIVAWEGCDHLGPVFEGDTLRSSVELTAREPLTAGGGLVHLRVLVRALRSPDEAAEVLDWRLVGVMA